MKETEASITAGVMTHLLEMTSEYIENVNKMITTFPEVRGFIDIILSVRTPKGMLDSVNVRWDGKTMEEVLSMVLTTSDRLDSALESVKDNLTTEEN